MVLRVIGPDAGDQACGETGLGRMSEPAEICHRVLNGASINSKNAVLQGVKVLISAGPTREYLDPVRYITNKSSGKMGYALAQAALRAGADVTLVSGSVSLPPPNGINLLNVETADQMYDAILGNTKNADIFIAAAAVADYRPALINPDKIKKKDAQTTLLLHKTKDILTAVAALEKPPFLVGFAAETNNLESYALGKLHHKRLDMIAANWVGQTQGGFDSDQNALEVFWENGRKSLPLMAKSELAKQLIALIATKFNEKNRTENT